MLTRMRCVFFIAAICLLLAASGQATVTSAATGTGNQGLQAGWVIDDNGSLSFPHSYTSQLPIIQEAGPGWIRVNFRLGNNGCYKDWTSVGCTGKTAIQQYRTFIDAAIAPPPDGPGLKVLGLLSNESWNGGQDQWIVNSAERNKRGTGDNAYIDAFTTNAAVVLMGEFQGKVTVWQVWNEPNAYTANPAPGVYTGVTFIYPSNFAQLLQHVYTASRGLGVTIVSGAMVSLDSSGVARTVNGKKVQVFSDYRRALTEPQDELQAQETADGQNKRFPPRKVTPAPTPTKTPAPPIGCSTSASAANYLACTYSKGQQYAGWKAGAYPLDLVGQHIYVDQWALTTAAKLQTKLSDVRSVYVAFEGSNTPKKTVITEIGWATNNVSLAAQAANLQTAYQTFAGVAYLDRAYWFANQDTPESALYYGLVDGDAAHKLSFTAYQTYAAY